MIVSTCDRRENLQLLLASLEHQTHPAFEVIVVVGPTRDDTLQFLRRDYADRVQVLECPQFNLSVSRNLGMRAARGEVMAFIDDDAVPCDRWLEQLCEEFAAGADGVGGTTFLARADAGQLQFRRGLVTSMAEQVDVRAEGSAHPGTDERWATRFHGTNMAYRADVLRAAGGFDERFEYLHDDADIAWRLRTRGARLVALDDAWVYHVGAIGRHRGRDPFDLNWLSWARSTSYFTLTNGADERGRRAAAVMAMRHVAAFRSRIHGLEKGGFLSAAKARRARRLSLTGALRGAGRAAGGRRTTSFSEPEAGSLLAFRTALSRRRAYPHLTRPKPVAEPLDQSPLKLALLSVDFPPASTEGVARSTATLARGLVELGHQVHVITLGDREADACTDLGFVHQIVPRMRRRYENLAQRGLPNVAARLRFSHQAADKVKRLVANHGVQVVDSPLWGVDGLVSVEAGTCPVVVRAVTAMRQIAQIHGQISDENTVMGELEDELLGRCHLIASNSEATRAKIEETYPQSHGRPHSVVPYGIVPGPDPDELERDQRDSQSSAVRVLFVGRLEARKGILELFEAIPGVLAACPDAIVEIAGSDNSRHDGFYDQHGVGYPEWFRRRHPKLIERVRFLGHVDDEELPRLYRRADVFVGPSRFESFGLVYVEAMDAGIPVVACDAGGPSEIVVDGETGRLVPVQDGEAVASALTELCRDRELRQRMGRAGRARMLERFTHLKMAQGFADVYRSLL